MQEIYEAVRHLPDCGLYLPGGVVERLTKGQNPEARN